MRALRFVATLFALVVVASTAVAATNDMLAIRTFWTDAPACTSTPLEHQPACLKARVKNLGPDPYLVAETSKGGGSGIAAGTLSIVVDIDEPTKPGQPRVEGLHLQKNFAVSIAAGDSVTLDFGTVGLNADPGVHSARMTVIALAPNVDPNPLNNQAITVFTVLATPPAAGRTGLVIMALGLAAAGLVGLRRRVRAARV